MKRRLNILCVIVMLVLGYSILSVGYYSFLGAKIGVEAASEHETDVTKLRDVMHMKYISLIPETFSMRGNGTLFLDSVCNEKTGAYVPATYSSMIVSVETQPDLWEMISEKLLNALQLIMNIWALVLFIRLVISINKSDIFNWRNVRRLRRLGFALTIGFCCMIASVYLSFHSLGEAFSLRGYELSISDFVDTTMLVLGICSLIVGEVFAIGLKMKEEQELTI